MQVETGFVFYEKILTHKINDLVLYNIGKIISWATFWLEKVVVFLQKYKSYFNYEIQSLLSPCSLGWRRDRLT